MEFKFIRKTHNFFSNLKYLLTQLYKACGPLIFIPIIFMILSGGIPLIRVIALANIVDSLSQDLYLASIWLGVVVSTFVYNDLKYRIDDFAGQHLKKRITEVLDKKIIDKVTNLPYEEFEDSTTYDQISRIGSEKGILLFNAYSKFLQLGQYTINLYSIAVYIGAFSLMASLGTAGIILIGIVLYSITARRSWKLFYDTTQDEREAGYLYDIMLNEDAMKEMKLFNAHNPLMKLYENKMDIIISKHLKTTGKNLILQWFSTLSLALFAFLLASQFAYLVRNNLISSGEFVGLVSGVSQMILTVAVYGINVNGAVKNYTKLNYFREFMTKKPEEKGSILNNISKSSIISLKNCSYIYPGTEFRAVDNVSLEVHEGESVAFVGENGAGKSTIVKLITGLYAPTDGAIQVMGKDPIKQIKNKPPVISAIFQDYAKFKITVSEIVSSGKEMDRTSIEDALKKASLYEDVKNLKDKKNTLLGKVFDGASELSEGQWQKLNIARVLNNPAPILIFDEPAASLDPISEAFLYEQMVKLKGSRTIVLVSHRLGALKAADRIFMLKDGRILAQGTHQYLMRNCNEYSEMYNNQAQWYNSDLVVGGREL